MQYLFDDFWTSTIFTFYGPDPSFSSPFYFNKYKKKKESSQKQIISSYLNFLEFQRFDILGHIRPNIFVSYFRNYSPQILMPNCFLGVFPWNNLWQPIILTKWKIISKSWWNQKYFLAILDDLSMYQECCVILIFLANQIFRFVWSEWIIGIYGKPIFWTLGISKNPQTPSEYRFPALHQIGVVP